VAEKFQSMIHLGMQNSRMKDFFDLFGMSRLFSFEGPVLLKAIQSTFQRRKTPIASVSPRVFSDEFSMDSVKHSQWKAFLNKNELTDISEEFPYIVDELRDFLAPLLEAASSDKRFDLSWKPGKAWYSE